MVIILMDGEGGACAGWDKEMMRRNKLFICSIDGAKKGEGSSSDLII